MPLPFVIFFSICTISIAGGIIIVLFTMFHRARVNAEAPQLNVTAHVRSRRFDTSTQQHPVAGDVTGAHGYTRFTQTNYYATFEVESGDRIELRIPRAVYDSLREGSTGMLYFRGSEFLAFKESCLPFYS